MAMALAVPVLPAVAQVSEVAEIATDGSATTESVDGVIAAVEARDDLDDETRSSVLESLRDARAQILNKQASEQAAIEFSQSLETAPVEADALREQLEEEAGIDVTAEDLGITERTPLAELEQRLAQEQAALSSLEAELSRLESQINILDGRPAAARDRIAELRRLRDELSAVIDTEPAPGQPAIVSNASKLAARLRRQAQSAEIGKLEQEILSNAARLELLNAQRDVAARTRLETQRRLGVLRTEVNNKRQAAALLAQRAAAAAEMAAADKHPVVRALAEGNARLTRELPSVAASIETVSSELERVNVEKREMEERLARSRQRIEIGGLSRAIGQLLEEERRNLPQFSRYRAAVRARSGLLADIGLAQLRIQEERRELSPLDAALERRFQEISDDVTDPAELETVRSDVRRLLRDRRDLLQQAERTYATYLQSLAELDAAQRQLLETATAYQEFLSQNQLWIPSAPILGFGDWGQLRSAFGWVLSVSAWQQTGEALVGSVKESAGFSMTFLVLLALLVLSRRPLRRRFLAINRRVGRLSTDHIGLTLAALGITAVRAAPVPLLFAVSGWFLATAPSTTVFSDAAARGLIALGPFLYNLLVFRVLSARDGVLQVHFRWREANLARIRAQLDRLIAIGGPLAFATVFFYLSDAVADRFTLGRLAFISLMVLLGWVMHPLLHPQKGVVADYYARNADYWASRLRVLWYVLAVAGPLALGLLSFLGYLYTSMVLVRLLVDTIWLALGMILVNLVVLRWLALTRRKLALKIALEEREARRAEKAREQAPQVEQEEKPELESEAPAAERKPVDLDEVDQQTRKILRSAIFFVAIVAGWGIWVQVLPAFNMLDQVALWTKTAMIDGVESVAPVTLADVLLALVVAAVTAIASKNLPGLMEITLLQRLTLQPGSRYAINTLLRYVVVTIGAISVLSIIGWDWSQIQWLVAALSVGLGFGLQEIVANFVSGLIILFERPVRVGDTVTVGALTGTVSKVRIRATTITDWDRKEIVVPNKAFITEQVVNWTLSDPITRIVVPVGISYGSDVQLAHRIMDETLRSLPLVLDEPEPRVYFIGFGESSLDFKLYVYSRQLADRLPLTHAVHESILEALRANGVEIPFPQRDLHIRSTVENRDA